MHCDLASCPDKEALATGLVLTGDIVTESRFPFCPTCACRFAEWEQVGQTPQSSPADSPANSSTCSDDSTTQGLVLVEGGSEGAAAGTDGEAFELVDYDENDEDDEERYGVLAQSESDLEPLLRRFRETWITDAQLMRGAGNVAAGECDEDCVELDEDDDNESARSEPFEIFGLSIGRGLKRGTGKWLRR